LIASKRHARPGCYKTFMSKEPSPALLLELCSLCPVEPACDREQMLEHVGCRRWPAAEQQKAFEVKGQPYRCWLLSLREDEPRAA
jgi:hypothetical protein